MAERRGREYFNTDVAVEHIGPKKYPSDSAKRTKLVLDMLKEMTAALKKNQGRVSAVVMTIVRSKQFQFIRGSDYEKASVDGPKK